MYDNITRPDISFVIYTHNLFIQHSKRSHWGDISRVVRYLKGNVGQEIWLKAQPYTSLIYSRGSDWASCPNTRRSVTGYMVYFSESLVS